MGLLSELGRLIELYQHNLFIMFRERFTRVDLYIQIQGNKRKRWMLRMMDLTTKSKLDQFASGTWEFFMKQDPQFLIDLENSFQCCGYNSIQDRSVPKTCAIAMNVTMGCKPFVETWIQEWRQWITAGIAILLALQLIVLVISVVFAYAVDCKMREEEADIAALSYQINHTTWRHNRHGYGSRGSTSSLL
ncbi:hypothetical protein EDC96DRAFT_492618 [Choanephora cucurbitarum]|nr:hypothetical protein EDC96DRAFT_492618 [Choanephora cucurbitarum]